MKEGRLERMRKLPAREKRKLAVLIAGAITGVIFLSWLGIMISGLEISSEGQQGNTSLSGLGDIVKNFSQSLSEMTDTASTTANPLELLPSEGSVSEYQTEEGINIDEEISIIEEDKFSD